MRKYLKKGRRNQQPKKIRLGQGKKIKSVAKTENTNSFFRKVECQWSGNNIKWCQNFDTAFTKNKQIVFFSIKLCLKMATLVFFRYKNIHF